MPEAKPSRQPEAMGERYRAIAPTTRAAGSTCCTIPRSYAVQGSNMYRAPMAKPTSASA